MHPQIQHDGPGSCPLCGMALEPVAASKHSREDPELTNMKHRLVLSSLFAMPLLVMMMADPQMHAAFMSEGGKWGQCVLATLVVLWGGWPFFMRGLASIYHRSLNMFTLIALGAGVAYGYSVMMFINPIAEGDFYFETAAMIIVFALLGQVLELRSRAATGEAMRKLLNLAPKTAHLVHAGGAEEKVQVVDLKPGDHVRIHPGEAIPVDGVMLEGESSLDQSLLTRESLPVAKKPGDEVTAGTHNLDGSFIMRCDRVGDATMLGQIAQAVAKAQRTRAPVQRLADTVSTYFVPVVIAVAVLTGLAWAMVGPEPKLLHALSSAAAVLMIASPCALGLATPMSVMVATGRGARGGILVREAAALERLGICDTLVVDKTGTLTEGKPKLIAVMPQDGYTETNLLRAAASLERASEHPIASAVIKEAEDRGIGFLQLHAFKSHPGKGVTGIMDGRSVGLGNAALMESLGVPVLKTKAEPYRSQGQIVFFISVDNKAAGIITVADPIKATTPEAIKQLKEAGFTIIMLTGDSKSTAVAVGRKLGIDRVEPEILPGRKAEIIRELQAKGHKVAMAGDGVNDALALSQADVGIAMGTGADIALESADITLLSGDLRGVVRAHRLSKATMRNIRQNLGFAFIYNLLGVPLAAGVLYPVFGLVLSPVFASFAMALSSVSVIGNALRLRNTELYNSTLRYPILPYRYLP